VRPRRAVDCLRTTRPLMGRRRWLDPSRGGSRRPIALARAGRLTHRDRWCAAAITGSSASAPGFSLEVTVRDQSSHPSVVTRGHGATGCSTRSGIAVNGGSTAADRVRRPGRRGGALCPRRVDIPSTATFATAARSVTRGGAGGWFLHSQCSRLRRSNLMPVRSEPQPARALPDPCVPAALLSPVWLVDFAPQVLAAPVPANGTSVETPAGPVAGSRRSVRSEQSVARP
jgi:hypothetical protein